MTTVDWNELRRLCDLHPKPAQIRFQYGTAGFRTLYVHTIPLLGNTSNYDSHQRERLGLRAV